MPELKPCPTARMFSAAFDMHFDCLDCGVSKCLHPEIKDAFIEARNRRAGNGMTREEAIEILKRVDICANAAETARDMAIAALREQKSPCDLCRYDPPSSMDGKPCTMCPASPKEE